MLLRPAWKTIIVRLCSPATRHHGTGKSCATKVALGWTPTVVASHGEGDDQSTWIQTSKVYILVASTGILPYLLLFSFFHEDHFCTRTRSTVDIWAKSVEDLARLPKLKHMAHAPW